MLKNTVYIARKTISGRGFGGGFGGGFGSKNRGGFGFNNSNFDDNSNNNKTASYTDIYENKDPIALISSLITLKDINWNIADIYGNNLLHYANLCKSYICHAALVNNTNININVANLEGNTPITYSIITQNNFVSELKMKGAKISDRLQLLNTELYKFSDYLEKKDIKKIIDNSKNASLRKL